MKKFKQNYPLLTQKTIIAEAAEGKSITKHDDLVVFVPFAASGDVVDIQITKKKKNYAEGRITQFHEYSDKRIEPKCDYFTKCGGCKWQHLSYENQLKLKQQQVIDDFERIAKVEIETILPIKGSNAFFNYRNKVEFTFSNKAWEEIFDKDNPKGLPALGFHFPGLFDKVIDIETCHIANDYSNQIKNSIKAIAVENQFDFFDLRHQTGWLRNLMIRNTSQDQWMVVLIVAFENEKAIKTIFDPLILKYPKVTEWCYVINNKRNDTWSDLEVETYKGKGYLEEKIEDKRYKIRPQSFFQTNTEQALVLYQIAREFAELTGIENVYDLYTGTGSIALFVSDKCKQITGIEYVEAAVIDAKENAALNNVKHAHFYAGDMKALLNDDLIQKHGKPDVIITDPPRDGMHPDVVNKLMEMEAKRIVYISCNPATQARDMLTLKEKYRVKKIQSVDLFPHTHHIENVSLLELKN